MIGSRQIYALDVYNPASIAADGLQPGARGEDEYGDLYRLVKVGASNITAGKLQVCPAPKTNHHNIAVSVAVTANGRNRIVTPTLGATAATLNEYAFGTLVFNDVSPEGETYRIYSHPAADASATLAIKLAPDSPLKTSITTSSELTLTHNVWNGVVEAAVEERQPAGVPLVDMTAAYYGWVKTRGDVSLLAGDSFNIGEELVQHASTAGAVDAASTTYGTAFAYWTVGKAKVAGVDTEYPTVTLTID